MNAHQRRKAVRAFVRWAAEVEGSSVAEVRDDLRWQRSVADDPTRDVPFAMALFASGTARDHHRRERCDLNERNRTARVRRIAKMRMGPHPPPVLKHVSSFVLGAGTAIVAWEGRQAGSGGSVWSREAVQALAGTQPAGTASPITVYERDGKLVACATMGQPFTEPLLEPVGASIRKDR